VTRRRSDEERNLEEAGDLERGKPIPVFFETLEHRVKHPEMGLDRKCLRGGPQGPRHGRGKPQGGRNPGAQARSWPAEKSSGGRVKRRREKTPVVKPLSPYGAMVPSSRVEVFGPKPSESG
jgi:hypothetical protein